MGLLDGLRAMVEPMPSTVQRSEATYDAFVTALNDLISDRSSSFTLAQARKLPPVIRGVSLIAGVGASMLPLAYQRGVALELQPRIVRKPDPFSSRYQFVYQTLEAMVASEGGEAFWLLSDHDARNHPRSAMVLPNDEVMVEWDERRFRRRFSYRGRQLTEDVDIKHIAPNRAPGQLHGKGPLQEALDYLYPVHEAEMYASSFFSSGGLPMTVIKAAQHLDKQQAADLKSQYMTVRDEAGAAPLVLGSGQDVDFPSVDPQASQMQESRGAGAAIVARVLGIPGALLQVETSGATITYTNPEGALEELVKTTIAPLYLAPLEAAWSELVPAPQAVRFDLADMQRASVADRFALYSGAIASGVMTAEEARAAEGWAPTRTDSSHAYDPVEVTA